MYTMANMITAVRATAANTGKNETFITFDTHAIEQTKSV